MAVCIVRDTSSRMGLTVQDKDKDGSGATVKDGLQVTERTAGVITCSAHYVASVTRVAATVASTVKYNVVDGVVPGTSISISIPETLAEVVYCLVCTL